MRKLSPRAEVGAVGHDRHFTAATPKRGSRSHLAAHVRKETSASTISPSPMNPLQQELLKSLERSTEHSSSKEIVYCSEWLGFLPFGLYHWVEVEGIDVSVQLPSGWQASDLDAIARTGLLLIGVVVLSLQNGALLAENVLCDKHLRMPRLTHTAVFASH